MKADVTQVEAIYIVGAGIFAEEIQDVVELIGNLKIEAFIEGLDKGKCKREINGIPIKWIDDIIKEEKRLECFCAIGSPKRKGIVELLEGRGFRFKTLIHPSSEIFPSALIKAGSFIGANSIIAARSEVGKQVIINRGCLIGHHVHIENHVTISPGANIAGQCLIREGSYIGMGAIIIDGIKVGANSVVGAGAVVTKDVPDNVQVLGVPARIVKEL